MLKMLTRLIAAVKIDLADAKTAFEIREYKYAIPACIFDRIYTHKED